MRLFLYFMVLSLCFSCISKKGVEKEIETKEVLTKEYQFPYQLDRPTTSKKLPENLKEISGLSLDREGNLYAVQDENGIIFKITDENIEETPFRKDGDYEGIEVVENHVYVVKSSGTVYKISKLGEAEQTREDFNGFLDDENDVEGLGYDKASHSLLLVCKGPGATEDGKRHIYKFNLNNNELEEKPYFSINISTVINEVKRHATEMNNEAFQKLIEKKGDEITFAPSAVAVHPISQNVYFTSSKGKMLLVTNNKGELIHLEKLDKSIHQQPEGLTFDREGNLYISNEGKDKNGIIYTFDYNPK